MSKMLRITIVLGKILLVGGIAGSVIGCSGAREVYDAVEQSKKAAMEEQAKMMGYSQSSDDSGAGFLNPLPEAPPVAPPVVPVIPPVVPPIVPPIT